MFISPLSLLICLAATKTQASLPARPRSPARIPLCRLLAGLNCLPRWSHSATSRSSGFLAVLCRPPAYKCPVLVPVHSLHFFIRLISSSFPQAYLEHLWTGLNTSPVNLQGCLNEPFRPRQPMGTFPQLPPKAHFTVSPLPGQGTPPQCQKLFSQHQPNLEPIDECV